MSIAAPPTPDSADGSVSVHSTLRWRWLAACLGLVALAFIQDPGRIAADTKLDLTADPQGLLARAADLWEPLAFFGQLQNQGYGYLFPLGPFYVIGDLLRIPDWVVQRAWWSVLLVVAFLGVVRLARLWGIAGFWPRLAGGLAFALGPRMVTELGVLSVEVLPYAVAPWVLVPLVQVARGGSLRKAAAWSGVAVACAGGVNAVASAAILPLGVWWILTRFTGRARWTLLGWWSLAVAAATLWWAIPLLLLGRYSPPFLDWIESASVTTGITSPDTVLRGTSQWVAYIAEGGGPTWPSGWSLVTQPWLIAATGVLAAIGVAGLALRTARYRLFTVGMVLIGMVLVGMGHLGVWPGLGAETIRDLLDGIAAPLRNTHKFEVLIRLPLALGVATFVTWVLAAARPSNDGDPPVIRRAGRVIGTGVVALAIVVTAQPVWAGTLTRDRSYQEIPGYWQQAALWLADEDGSGRALLLPGASFGVYSWGRTNDEPLQVYAQTPWAVRDAVPLSEAGAIRWMDAVAERLTTGRGSPGLADALARAGIEWIVVRNDLDRRRAGSARPELIRQGLLRSGGIVPVASFGPVLPPYRTETTVVDDGLTDVSAAVEIWRVEAIDGGTDPRVVVRPATDVLVVSGAAESLLDLADAGVLDAGTAVVVAGDEAPLRAAAASDAITLRTGVTDSARRSEVDFGRSWANRSSMWPADEEFLADRAVYDYLEPEWADGLAVVEFRGGRVSASSSGGDAGSIRARGAGNGPYAAIDSDPLTAWVSGDAEPGVGQWWQIDWDEPVDLEPGGIEVRLMMKGASDTVPLVVETITDAGTRTTQVKPTESVQTLAVAGGPTRSLRIQLVEVDADSPDRGFGIFEVGLEQPISRIVTTGGQADAGPIVLTARRGEQAGCLAVGGIVACSESLVAFGEERTGLVREVFVEQAGDYRVSLSVRPRAGPALDALLEPVDPSALRATASSQRVPDAAVRPQAAVDGSLETAWLADAADTRPELQVAWSTPRTITGVQLGINPALAASRPLTVSLTAGGLTSTSVVSEDGVVRMPPTRTSTVTIRFDNASAVRNLDPLTGAIETLPLGVSEVTLLGAGGRPLDLPKGPTPAEVIAVPCGFGPSIAVNGAVALTTSVATTAGDVLTDGRITASPCDGRVVSLEAGRNFVAAGSTGEFAVESILLEPVTGTVSVARTDTPEVLDWSAAQRVVRVAPADDPRLLELTENANDGWQASVDGVVLTPIRVDGWRQGWVVPAGVGGDVRIEFAPDRIYAIGLLLGGIALAGLVVLLLWPARRRWPPLPEPVEGGRPWILAAMAGLASLVIAGLPGLGVAAIGVGIGYLAGWWGRIPQARAGIAGLSVAAAGVLAAFNPWPGRLDASDVVLAILTGLTVLGLAVAAAPMFSGGSSAESAARWRTTTPTPPER